MLYAARWLLGGDELYTGKVKLEATAVDDGESVKVQSTRGLEGLVEPGPLSASGVVVADWPDEAAEGGTHISLPELLGAMFSQDERNILRVLCAAKRGMKAVDVMAGAKIDKTRFWALWSNLQHRGLVKDADADEGEGGGFVVGAAWVRELVEVGGGKAGTAA